MWIDTHCHLDAREFDADRDGVVARAISAGIDMMVLPAVDRASFTRVRDCAYRYGYVYALGIHPLYVAKAQASDLEHLRRVAHSACTDPRFVAIGEIGLDCSEGAPAMDLQEAFYREQLQIAYQLQLPVILHVRRSADRLLYYLRRVGVTGGIAHAFNGSDVQAQAFLELGMRLGFGGAATYDGSRRIRRFATQLPSEAIVLETDAPDIPPQWLRVHGAVGRNEPCELAPVAAVIAKLRGISDQDLAQVTGRNALTALPRLAQFIVSPP
ncbi:MAG TPA: TatD family hydrolase [Burkholderiaceae bacterium]|jgi:TatD DNase family protein|nr:TatD family hydrolase [Burkholderiaceae bacterium]